MTSSDPPPDPRAEHASAEDPHRSADDPGDLRRWLRRIVLGLVLLVAGWPSPCRSAGAARTTAPAAVSRRGCRW